MRWLHLSDIHFNPKKESYYTRTTLQNLPFFLNDEKITADHMFVTGDYRHAFEQKDQPEKEAAESTVNYIIEVAKKARIPLKNIHVIPGNHDLKRFEKDKEEENIKKLEAIRQKYIDSPKVFDEEDLIFLNSPFSFFEEICNALKSRVPDIHIPWYVAGKMKCTISECYDEFSLLYLNTCLFCHTDNSRNAGLLIDSASVGCELEKIRKNNKGKPIIILAHHEMGGLERTNKEILENILRESSEPIIYLCGDTHESWVRKINDILEITVGCLVDAKSVKTMIALGECNGGGFTSILGYNCERGKWGIYPQFNAEVQKYMQTVKQHINCGKQQTEAELIAEKEKFSKALPSSMISNSRLIEIIKEKGKNPDAYFKVWAQPYGLLVTDITGVLFKNVKGKEEFSDNIICALAHLAKRHISICFTTGRGRTGARHLLLNLAQKIIEMDSSLSWETLSGEWACITHNGAYLLTTPDKSRSGFLANEEPLCPEKHRHIKYHVESIADELRSKYKAAIEKVCKNKRYDSISKIVYDLTIEPVSVRFSLEHCDETICNHIFAETKKFCKDLLQEGVKYDWYATRGKYEQKEMFEYSLVNKSDAVKDYIKRYRSIDMSNIIRIADTGQQGGSDYDFLIDGPSFSVEKYTMKKDDTCFPVIHWERNEVLYGTEATVYLLERLHFYPSLCIKSVADTRQYKISFANAISGAKKRSEEIFKFYNTRMAWMDFLYEDNFDESNTLRIFDVKSGAITFSDYEWSKIEMMINETENDTLEFLQMRCFEQILNSKIIGKTHTEGKPCLMYFVHTDTHVIFRGYLYYAFFIKSLSCAEGTDSITIKEWVEVYQQWFREAQKFVELFIGSLKDLKIDMSVPISYLTRKLIIGSLDNIRNILLILNHFYMRQYVLSQDSIDKDVLITNIGDSTDALLMQCNKISNMLSSCLSSMYTALFESQIDMSFIDIEGEACGWLTELERFLKEREGDYDYLSDKKKNCILNLFPYSDVNLNETNEYFTETFQRWRESDCFIENVSAIEVYLSKMVDSEKKLVFWGIPYGSLEHPILANLLCQKHGLKAFHWPCYVMLHGKYESRHLNEFELFIPMLESVPQPYTDEVINILIDDTLTTAKTLDLGAKCLALYNIALNDVIVMRYAGLNRLNHYLTNVSESEGKILNASAPDVTKFFSVISGLVAEAPYSKLHKYGSSANDNKPYEDMLGVFDKSKNRMKNYLSINYDYL